MLAQYPFAIAPATHGPDKVYTYLLNIHVPMHASTLYLLLFWSYHYSQFYRARKGDLCALHPVKATSFSSIYDTLFNFSKIPSVEIGALTNKILPITREEYCHFVLTTFSYSLFLPRSDDLICMLILLEGSIWLDKFDLILSNSCSDKPGNRKDQMSRLLTPAWPCIDIIRMGES